MFSNNFWKIGNDYILYINVFQSGFWSKWYFLGWFEVELLNLFCGDSNNLISVDLVPLSTEIYFVYYSCSIVQLSGFRFRITNWIIIILWIYELHFIWFIIWVLCCCLIVSLVVGCFSCCVSCIVWIVCGVVCFSCFGRMC